MTSENGFWRKLRLTLDMIKFEHSLFALPFALTGALLAIREDQFAVQGLGWKILWIVVAMVSARSAAMGFNRWWTPTLTTECSYETRHLPAGLLTRMFAWLFVAAAALVFLLAAGDVESVLPASGSAGSRHRPGLFVTKRFTSFSHVVLGFALGIAPAAAWIAIRGSLDPSILWLTAAVTFWTADSTSSIPARIMSSTAAQGCSACLDGSGLRSASGCRDFHFGMLGCLVALVRASLSGLSQSPVSGGCRAAGMGAPPCPC